MTSSAALKFDFRGEKRGGSVPSILELPVSIGHTSSIHKVDGLHGIKGKHTLLSSSVTKTAFIFKFQFPHENSRTTCTNCIRKVNGRVFQ